MTTPLQPPTCGVCGTQLPPDAPDGNCPACLWSLALSGLETTGEPETSRPRRFGSYELIEEIARGGMGVVWRARQAGLGRDVALKMMLSGRLATSAQVLRFYTEARAAARLDHSNIVPIFDVGEDEDCHFYTMRLMEGRLMEGRSLADALKNCGAIPGERAARITAIVARALHFAHQRGVLHRDVKPSNILLDAQGDPHIADFGLARIAEEDSGASRTDSVIGTPAYMAPEQASGPSRELTTAADIYGLGAVLYELLTGKPPFQMETPLQTLRLVVESAPKPPRAVDARIAHDLEVICLKCLQKQPEKRYASAAELADDLERWLQDKPILARPVSSLERLASWARRKPELATALGALSGVLALALAVSITLFVQVQTESEGRAISLRSEEGQRLAFQSLAVVESNPGQALLLALEAAERAPSLNANNALLASLEACRERRRFLGHTSEVTFAAFSPEGERVATASHDGTARLWSVGGVSTPLLLKGHAGGVVSVEFSADGKRVLTASADAIARIWDAESGEQLVVLSGHVHALKSAHFSPDGERVLTVSQNTARLWDSRSGKVVHLLDQHTEPLLCSAFSPNGERVVTGSVDGTALIWDVATGALVSRLTGHTAYVHDVCFSADGKRVATASLQDACVWDFATGKEISVLRGHTFDVYSVALTPDGATLATGSEDFTARVWDVASGRERYVLRHGHKVIRVQLSRDGAHLVTASYDKLARVWDLQTGALVSEFRGHAAPLNFAAFSPDGQRVVTASVDFTARLWMVRPADPLVAPASFGADVVDAALSPDGDSMVEASLGSPAARVLDLASGRELTRLEAHEGQVRAVSYSFDGSRIITGSDDKTARLWDAKTGRMLRILSGHSAKVYSCSFSKDGLRALAVSYQTARVWKTVSGEELAVIQCPKRIHTASFSPDGERVLLADEGSNLWLRELSLSTKSRLSPNQFGGVTWVDFGPEGRSILSTWSTTRAQIRSFPEGQLLATLVHPARVMYAVYSPDNRWIASASADSTLSIWSGVTQEKWLEVKKPGYQCARVSISRGENRVLVLWYPEGQRDAQSLVLDIYPIDVVAAAGRSKFGDLTPDERDHFQVGRPEAREKYRKEWRGGHIYGDGEDGAR